MQSVAVVAALLVEQRGMPLEPQPEEPRLDQVRARPAVADAHDARLARRVAALAIERELAVQRSQERLAVEPPRPLREYMGLGSWQLQDANWWADFPASAAQAAVFWRPG